MSQNAKVAGSSSAWVDEFNPNKVMPQSDTLYVGTTAGQTRYGYVSFPTAWVPGATIISATLRMRGAAGFPTGNYTAKIRAITSAWSNNITYALRPTVGTTETTGAKTDPANQFWDVDVTSIIQAAANGAPWYGLRIEITPFAAMGRVKSTVDPTYGPRLIVEYSKPPDQPTGLKPSTGRAISQQKPLLTYVFNDPAGGDNQIAQQVQISDTQAELIANTPDFDSGEVATTIPQYDSASGAWTGIPDLATRYWRVRAKDSDGLWSVWSDPVPFRRDALGVVAFDGGAPTGITEGSPTFSWTFTETQTAYRVLVTSPNSDTGEPVYDSGIIAGTATSHNVPFGKIKYANWNYVVEIRVYDNVAREAIPGDPGYATVSAGPIPVVFSGAVASPTSFGMVQNLLIPSADLEWEQASTPAYYQLLRSMDGGDTWEYIKESIGVDRLVSGTSYQWNDNEVPQYENIWWRLVAVNSSGVQSAGAIATGNVRRVCPALYFPDNSRPVLFLNPQRSMGFQDLQGVHQPLDGPPVLVTQRLGKQSGNMRGRLTNDLGISADEQLESFLYHRLVSGAEVRVAVANRTFRAFAYNFQYDILTDASGITYDASFDWMEI